MFWFIAVAVEFPLFCMSSTASGVLVGERDFLLTFLSCWSECLVALFYCITDVVLLSLTSSALRTNQVSLESATYLRQ